MDRSFARELEFDKVLELVAAHARTGVGRTVVADLARPLGQASGAIHAARLCRAVSTMIEEDEALALAGIDDALPWLDPSAPPPTEPRELVSLLTLARRIVNVRKRLGATGDELLESLARDLPDTEELVRSVAPRLGRDGKVSDNASPELSRLRREMGRVRSEVLGELESIRRANREVVTDAPPTLRRDRYCLPVRSSARSQLQGLLLDVSSRGATAFVEPFPVVELNNRLTAAVAGERAEIHRILREIAELFADARDDLSRAVDILAELDAVQAKVFFGRAVDGRIVEPGGGGDLVLRGARHPLLDERLAGLRLQVFTDSEKRNPDHRAVPLDFRLPEGVRTMVISGPNAGGKTVVLKTLGLMVLMSSQGIPIPVSEGSSIPRLGRLWCHIGDEQDVSADLSTFSGAMAATARLLENASSDTLVLFDELGAGTDPMEGAALGCALLEELTRRGGITIVSTHLAAIALAANSNEAMDNAAMDYDETTERPTYNLTVGRPGRSRALEIADRMGVMSSVLDRARELLGGDHLELERWLRRLEALETELEEERFEVRKRMAEADGVRQEARREFERLEMERHELLEKLAAERDALRRRAKEKLDKAVARLKKATEEHETLGKRRLAKLREEAMRLEVPSVKEEVEADRLEAGTAVKLLMGGRGVLREVRGSRAQVDVSGKRLWVPLSELRVVEAAPKSKAASIRVESAEASARELKLIGLDSERAREDLERFLDRAHTSGLAAVRIVHGHGAGILRRMVAEVCRSHPAVRSFRHPPQNLGGTGATEVELEGA